MSKLNYAVYAEGCMYPATAPAHQPVSTTISQLQQSGFTTAILSLFHIGRNYSISPPQIMGDIYFNDTLIISNGSYVGDSSWPGLINGMIKGTVAQVCASIGGGGVMDFQTIQKIYASHGNSFAGTNLEQNFKVLQKEFPSISIIDMDCEEAYDQDSFVAFCQMLIDIGFGITFCPYTYPSFWTGSLAALNNSNHGAVKWWNMQCYDGGTGNDPAKWAEAITQTIPEFSTDGFILAGDWTNDDPPDVQTLMSTFTKESCVGGGFIWTLDQIIQKKPQNPLTLMKDYVDAISVGLGKIL
ncbi:MAG: hypothetical protein ABFS45_19470 [Pseudomonadota bacterium]